MSELSVVGLFVGGRGRRMGGAAKGNLLGADGRTLLARLAALAAEALPGARLVLVGNAESYRGHELTEIADMPPGIGPLGGLAALLGFAEGAGAAGAIALSCDLPYIGARLIQRLAREAPEALALAPRDAERWSPLTARYAVAALPIVNAAIERGAHSVQRVFEALGDSARELELDASERLELRDWDRPEDIER